MDEHMLSEIQNDFNNHFLVIDEYHRELQKIENSDPDKKIPKEEKSTQAIKYIMSYVDDEYLVSSEEKEHIEKKIKEFINDGSKTKIDLVSGINMAM